VVFEQVVERLKYLLDGSVASSSRAVYSRAWRLYLESVKILRSVITLEGIFPLKVNEILFYIGYLSWRGFAASTITTYVSAIGYIHRIKGVFNPASSFLIQKVLASVNKTNPTQDTRLPITLIILQQLSQSLPQILSNHYHVILLRAMFLIAFFGLMRIGEITFSSSKKSDTIQLNQISISKDHLIIKIRHFKHNISLRPFEIVVKRQTDPNICPLLHMSYYLQLRGFKPGSLFQFQDGGMVNRNFFTSRLKGCLNFIGLDSTFYQAHSFRIGGASYLASVGMSDAKIRMIGRWKSDAFKRYIRCQRILSSGH